MHILLAEGYHGFGVDVRARTSWSYYPPTTQIHLHVKTLDPTLAPEDVDPAATLSNLAIVESPLSLNSSADPPGDLGSDQKGEDDQSRSQSQLRIPHGAFIIGNHADELTPYVPILSILYGASGYLNIPCCPWDLDQKFSRANSAQYPHPGDDTEADNRGEVPAGVADIMVDGDQWIESLNLGGGGKFTSSYSAYRIWLSRLTSWCGWEIETEVLRIPSTRNWALVGNATEFRSRVLLATRGF